MGVVIDEEVARKSPCLCYRIGETDKPEDLMCFSRGIIGTLSNAQDIKFCPEKEIKPATAKVMERLRLMKKLKKVE